MRNKLLLVLLALSALAITGCNKLQARDNLNHGVRAFREAHYEDAIRYFKEAIQLDPELTNAQLYLATAYAQQFIPGAPSPENVKNAEMAIQEFQKVIQRDPNNIGAIAGLASIYQNTVRFDDAKKLYVRQAQLSPEDPVTSYSVGSINWWMLADRSNPRSPEEKGQLIEEGLKYLDRAIQINPDYEDAISFKNLLYRQKAEIAATPDEKKQWEDEADKWFNAALDARKRNAEKKKQTGIVLEK